MHLSDLKHLKTLQAKARAEEAKKAAIEAERRAMKEATEREAAENLKKVDVVQAQETTEGQLTTKPINSVSQPKGSALDGTNVSRSPGDFQYVCYYGFSVFVEKLI